MGNPLFGSTLSISCKNYVKPLQNYVILLQNYVFVMHNHVKPCKTMGILDQDRITGDVNFSKKNDTRYCAPIVRVL